MDPSGAPVSRAVERMNAKAAQLRADLASQEGEEANLAATAAAMASLHRTHPGGGPTSGIPPGPGSRPMHRNTSNVGNGKVIPQPPSPPPGGRGRHPPAAKGRQFVPPPQTTWESARPATSAGGTRGMRAGGGVGGSAGLFPPESASLNASFAGGASFQGTQGPGGGAGGGMSAASMAALSAMDHSQLVLMVAAQQDKLAEMAADIVERRASYMRRENEYKAEVASLKEELEQQRQAATDGHPAAMRQIKELYGKIKDTIGSLPTKDSVLNEQEEMLAAFRKRLNQVEVHLQSERRKIKDGNFEWMEKTLMLRKDLETSQATCRKLDKFAKSCQEQMERLRVQYQCQEEDREYLVRQLVAAKRESQRLRDQVAELEAALASATQRQQQQQLQQRAAAFERVAAGVAESNSGGDGGGAMGFGDDAAYALYSEGELGPSGASGPVPSGFATSRSYAGAEDHRGEDVVGRLKKLLELERKRVRAARTAHLNELAARNEMQQLLKAAIDEVKEKRRALLDEKMEAEALERIAAGQPQYSNRDSRPKSSAQTQARHMSSVVKALQGTPGAGGASSKVGRAAVLGAPLTPAEREAALTALLSKERVLTLVFGATFPELMGRGAGKVMDALQHEEPGGGPGQGPPGGRQPGGGGQWEADERGEDIGEEGVEMGEYRGDRGGQWGQAGEGAPAGSGGNGAGASGEVGSSGNEGGGASAGPRRTSDGWQYPNTTTAMARFLSSD
eukprot:jgi/Mesvir1/14929/Mv05519-RA.1